MVSTPKHRQSVKFPKLEVRKLAFAQQPFRKLNFPDHYSWTDHAEFTATLFCPLIARNVACPGCTAINPQDSSGEGMIGFRGRIPYIIPEKVVTVHEQLKKKGINLITDMGGDVLTMRGYEHVIKSFAEDPVLDGLVYTASLYYLKSDGTPSRLFEIHEKAGLFSDAMYLLASVDRVDGKDQKSQAGINLLRWLVNHGYNLERSFGMHMTIRHSNLRHIIPLYKIAKQLKVWFSLCDLVYKPYISRRKDPAPYEIYKDRLQKSDIPFLRQAINLLIKEESKRIIKGEERILVPSSAFLRMSMTRGPFNEINCKIHRGGKLPNTFDVHPNGKMRADIANNTVEDVENCQGCAYISLDRGHSDWQFFGDGFFGAKIGDIAWSNAFVNRKHPAFRADRKNLAFQIDKNGLRAPYYTDIIYYNNKTERGERIVNDGRCKLRDSNYYLNKK